MDIATITKEGNDFVCKACPLGPNGTDYATSASESGEEQMAEHIIRHANAGHQVKAALHDA